MTRLAIIDDTLNVALDMADWSPVQARCQVDRVESPFASIDAAVAALEPYEIISTLRERTPFPAELLRRLPNLKLVCTTGHMHRTLDHEAATELGIAVSGSVDRPGGHQGTPELAFGLMISLARRIPFNDRRIRQGLWQAGVGVTLAKKTLGVVGLGKIGSTVARVAQAFGMNVIAWSPNLTDERAAAAGVRRVEKDELFRSADFVTVHLILGERTRRIIGAREIGLMKPTAYFINTARGPLADEDALVDALRDKRIAGVGLDVYHQEPMGVDHPLYAFDTAVLTPHIGYVVEDSYRAFYEDTVENVLSWLDGKPLRLRNPEVLRKGLR